MADITRRDFVNGTLVAAGSTMLSTAGNNLAMAALDPTYYPPALTGLRGSHPGSNDHAHSRAWTGKSDWGATTDTGEHYDLVVVGGGISGLSAAWFYREKYGADKRILILDNHDDFGGHAKRNEHKINGQLRISYGGSQTLVEPLHADPLIHNLLTDIGIDLDRFETAYDRDFFKRHNLGAVTYFNRREFGRDVVVRHPFCNYPNYVEGLLSAKLSNEEAVNQTPLSKVGKQQLLQVLNGGLHKIDVPADQLKQYILSTPYFDYLTNTLSVDDPAVMRMARYSALDWASAGTDVLSIAAAKSGGAMGFEHVPVYDADNPYIHHLPDGNAGVTRALVKKLIPAVTKAKSGEDLVLARFDYSQLDEKQHSTRIRLNSTVVDVQHRGDPRTAEEVTLSYINDGKSHLVTASNVVLACYNMMIPHIVSDLPEQQASALRQQTKSPLQYTTLGLRNWRAMKEMEIGMAMSPGNMHQAVLMDFPVSLGGYQFTQSPNDPCVLQMIACPYGQVPGTPRREQFREARYEMLGLQFSDYEAEIREHLSGMLSAELFDFDRDVASITVNRWAHGYSVPGSPESVQEGRKPFGRMTVANSDSAPGSDAILAMMMAHRAVTELG